MRIEQGRLENVRVGTLEAAFAALDARIEIKASWHGAALDRLVDEGHARLSGHFVASLDRSLWVPQVECSFSHFGERGSIDVLAWHEATGSLLVVEVKTELGSIEGLLRPLDATVRLASKIARERFGWRPETVSRLVVFPDRMSVRRQVARHAAVLDVALAEPGLGRSSLDQDARRGASCPLVPLGCTRDVPYAESLGDPPHPGPRHGRRRAWSEPMGRPQSGNRAARP